jgi:hypothetical protein
MPRYGTVQFRHNPTPFQTTDHHCYCSCTYCPYHVALLPLWSEEEGLEGGDFGRSAVPRLMGGSEMRCICLCVCKGGEGGSC